MCIFLLTNKPICAIIYKESEGTPMLQKNIDKEKRKARETWGGYYTRKTPTKKQKIEKNRKKYKKTLDKE
jgi:hypothetical protein